MIHFKREHVERVKEKDGDKQKASVSNLKYCRVISSNQSLISVPSMGKVQQQEEGLRGEELEEYSPHSHPISSSLQESCYLRLQLDMSFWQRKTPIPPMHPEDPGMDRVDKKGK